MSLFGINTFPEQSQNLYSEAQSMADLDFLMKADNVTMQNFMQAHEGKVNLTNIELFYLLNTITADFESKFGPDAVKEMITKTGGKISDNSRPVIDLVNLVFSEKQDFNGFTKFVSAANSEPGATYSDDVAGILNIFIDGLDTYAKKLNLKPLNN